MLFERHFDKTKLPLQIVFFFSTKCIMKVNGSFLIPYRLYAHKYSHEMTQPLADFSILLEEFCKEKPTGM